MHKHQPVDEEIPPQPELPPLDAKKPWDCTPDDLLVRIAHLERMLYDPPRDTRRSEEEREVYRLAGKVHQGALTLCLHAGNMGLLQRPFDDIWELSRVLDEIRLATGVKKRGTPAHAIDSTVVVDKARAVPDGVCREMVIRLSSLCETESIGFKDFVRIDERTARDALPKLINLGLAERRKGQRDNNIMKTHYTDAVAALLNRE
jgi:hypothetical protein